MGESSRDLPETASVSDRSAAGEVPASSRQLSARPPLREVRPGDSLGRFTVGELIGAGGMGRVFAAFDPQLGRTVALKLIHPDRTARPEARVRLLREAQALARLHHPNVVTVYDVDTQDDQVFVAMELIEGPTLAQWLRTDKPTWREKLSTFIAAGRGLMASHSAGIVHRDFKPQNVIVGKERVVVVDFGLARAGGDLSEDPATASVLDHALLDVRLTATGERVGTLQYMSPEQFAHGDVGPQSDQYSFCVALWEALHGELPSGAKRTDSRRRADIPRWLSSAVRRGLSRNPDERWPGMRELLTALASDPAKRRRRIALAAAGVAITAVALWGMVRSDRVAPPCPGAAARMAGVWDPARKASARAAFLATKLGHAEDVWSRVRARIDDYAARWIDMHTQTCLATRVDGRQSDTLMDLRMSCLERRRAVLGALGDVWSRGMDAETLEAATGAARGLPPVAECADTRALTERTPLPDDPAVRAKIDEARTHLDAVTALRLAHRWAEASEAATRVRAEADATGWPHVRAEAAFAAGAVLYELRDPRSGSVLLDAARAAGDAHDDRLAARALLQLVEVLSVSQESTGRALLVADIAEGVIARAGGEPALRGQLLHNRGETLLAEARFAEAKVALLAAEPLFTAAFGANDAETLANTGQLVRVYVGQGDYAAARKLGEQNLAATVAALGEEHPYVGVILNNLAMAVAESADYQAAWSLYQRALAIEERVAGADAERAATEVDNLGQVAMLLGNLGDAQTLFARARTIHERVLGPDHPRTAESFSSYAALERKQGRYREALALLHRGLAIVTKASGAADPTVAAIQQGIGAVLENEGDAAGALGAYRRANDVYEKALGAAHPLTLESLSRVARVLARQRRCAEARPLHATAISGFEKAVGPEHPRLAVPLVVAAVCDLADGQAAPAVARLERAISMVEKMTIAPIDRGVVRWPLARALWSLGKHDAAIAAAEQAVQELGGDADGARDRVAASGWLAAHRGTPSAYARMRR